MALKYPGHRGHRAGRASAGRLRGWQSPQEVTVSILQFKLSHSGLKAEEKA